MSGRLFSTCFDTLLAISFVSACFGFFESMYLNKR